MFKQNGTLSSFFIGCSWAIDIEFREYLIHMLNPCTYIEQSPQYNIFNRNIRVICLSNFIIESHIYHVSRILNMPIEKTKRKQSIRRTAMIGFSCFLVEAVQTVPRHTIHMNAKIWPYMKQFFHVILNIIKGWVLFEIWALC